MAGIVRSMAVFDDGSGAALYVGGTFGSVSGVPTEKIARWDGSAWSSLGDPTIGMSAAVIRSMAVFDDGTGPALYVGGNALAVDGVPTGLARWDGIAWTAVEGAPQPANAVITAITVHDDGSGSALYIGGINSGPPFDFPIVSRYAPSESRESDPWSIVGRPLNGSITALASFDDGTGRGPALYVAGPVWAETPEGSVFIAGIARLHDNAWMPIGAGLSGAADALFPTTDLFGSGAPALLVGGSFSSAGGMPSSRVAAWLGCATAQESSDLNGDGVVDGTDLGILLQQWGTGGAADLNGDGTVDGADLGLLLSAWT